MLTLGDVCRLECAVLISDGAGAVRAEIPAGVVVMVVNPAPNGIPTGAVEVETAWPKEFVRRFIVPEAALQPTGMRVLR